MISPRGVALLLLVSLAGCSSPEGEPPAEKGVTRLSSASVVLPEDDDDFGAGPGATLLNGQCLACHSASMVRYQPRLSADAWRGTVVKMRDVYGAPIAAEEVDPLVEALMQAQAARKE